MSERAKRLLVFAITEEPEKERAVWTKVGQAFLNRDGSYNIHLTALPVSGKLRMRDAAPTHATSSEDRATAVEAEVEELRRLVADMENATATEEGRLRAELRTIKARVVRDAPALALELGLREPLLPEEQQ